MSKQAIDIQKKYKTAAQIRNVAEHNLRQGVIPTNCDETKTYLNTYLVGSKNMNVVKEVDKKLEGIKYRKDAVKTAHMVFSASSDFFDNASKEEIADWEQSTLNYVKDTFGEKNIVYAVMHYDETTPHMHVCAVPLVDNKLAYNKLFIGKKGLANYFHTKYNDYVKHLGIERGERYSKADKTEIREYTTTLKAVNEKLEWEIEETKQQYKQLEKQPEEQYNLFKKIVGKLHRHLLSQKLKIKEQSEEKKQLAKHINYIEDNILEPLKEVIEFDNLPTKQQLNEFLDTYKQFKHTNQYQHTNNINKLITEHRTEAQILNDELKAALTPKSQKNKKYLF